MHFTKLASVKLYLSRKKNSRYRHWAREGHNTCMLRLLGKNESQGSSFGIQSALNPHLSSLKETEEP